MRNSDAIAVTMVMPHLVHFRDRTGWTDVPRVPRARLIDAQLSRDSSHSQTIRADSFITFRLS